MNRLVLFISISLVNYLGSAQAIQGRYERVDCVGMAGKVFEFKENKFTHSEFTDTGDKTGEGHFKLNRKKLILTYDKIPYPDGSTYEITKEKLRGNGKSTYFKVTVLNGANNNMPFYGAFIFFGRDEKRQIQIFSDSLGVANFMILESSLINNIKIVAIGYDIISIPINDLENKFVSIEAVLRIPKVRHIPSQTVEYKIREKSSTQIRLSNKSEKLTLKKENQE